MQFQGGYKPRALIFVLFISLAIAITILIWFWKSLKVSQVVTLFLNLEGTVLLASSFSPTSQVPPPKKILGKIRWFFREQNAVAVSYNRPLFYGGLVFLFVAFAMSAIIA